MKKAIILLSALLMAGHIQAQVAHWIIPPYYDSIYFATGADFIITDSLNEKIIWTPEGKRLFKTSDKLYPFSEGLAVTTKQNSDEITGFYSTDGKFTSLENCKVANDYPFYSNGYMVVISNDRYHFVDTKGSLDKEGYVYAYPFLNGYASIRKYKNPEKPKDKDVYNVLFNKDGSPITFSFNGKTFSPDDIEFISSMNDEGLCIVVIKHMVYFYEGEGKELRPIFARREEEDLKQQAKLKGKISVTDLENSTMIANCGKTDQISIRFNARLVPIEIWYNAERCSFKNNKVPQKTVVSPIDVSQKNGLWGLSIDGEQILPAQFEAIYDYFDNNAFVKLSGKQGLLHASKEKFKISINEDQEIGFRHKIYKTSIRLQMPHFIPTENTIIETVNSDLGCEIEPYTKKTKDTPSGNFIEYQCKLSIPQNLPDEITDFSSPYVYSFQVISDGISFPIYRVKIPAWYVKHFIIDIVKSETKIIKKGTISFTIDINDQKTIDDKYDYHKSVKIVPDTIDYDPKKISDTRYEFQVENLNYGINDLTIEVIEEGCPPSTFDVRIDYEKPSAKTKNKEKVEVRKKTKEDIKPAFDL
jgi:hypothetical protein